jgi:hypothetical protein
MDTIIYVAAAAIAAVSTVAARIKPAVFIKEYRRWSSVISYAALAGLLWVAIRNASALSMISEVLQDTQRRSPESALHRVQMLATEAVHEQRAYIPALFALLLALVYMDVLGRARARSGPGHAA